jgi:hypothetical protein
MDTGKNRDVYQEETKTDDYACRHCLRTIPSGRLFEHESTCAAREKSHQYREAPRQAAYMGAITHPGKQSEALPKNHWRAKHQEFITAIKLGKQMAAL